MSKVRTITETQQFKDLVEDLKAGRTDRKAMAAQLGIVPPELSKCFRIAGLLDELKKTKQTSLKPNNMDKLLCGDPDNARANLYRQATAEALTGNSIADVARKYPGVNYQVLARRVRAAKSASGATVS